MGYERTLVTRWTRRDWLAIAIIALTVMFLVGTSVLLLATSDQLDGEVQTLDGLATAEYTPDPGAASAETVHLPVATARTGNDSEVAVVGLPDRTVRLSSSFDETTLSGPPPDGVTTHGTRGNTTVYLQGRDANLTLSVRPAPDGSVLPTRWYATRPATVRALGQTGTLEIDPDAANASSGDRQLPAVGTLLLGTPGFLVGGADELLGLLTLVTIGSGLLVGVTVYSITRMTVRDRRRMLFVVRSTGGTRRRLVGLFGLRAGLLTAVGAAFGYAAGVILISASFNVATYYGTLTTLDVSGSPTDRILIGGMIGVLLLVGGGAGALSARKTAYAPPASLLGAGTAIGTGGGGLVARVRAALGVTHLRIRAVVPMTAALTVLIAIVVLSVSLTLTLAPLAGATDGVVMSPDASYALQSQVDQDLVASFRAAGIPASPEVLLPQVRDGQPYVLRGVNYSAYTQVSDVSVTAGRAPDGPEEAVIGEGLARTLGVGIGDQLTVGGGTSFGVDRVTVVGRFDGPGYLGDQLLVSLSTAKGLANFGPGTVQIIRTRGADEPPGDGRNGSVTPTPTPTTTPSPTDIVVTGVEAPATGVVNTSIPVSVTLANRGGQAGTRTLTIPVNGTEMERTVSVAGNTERTVTMFARFRTPGTYDVTLGGSTVSVSIAPAQPDIAVRSVTVPDSGLVNRSVPVTVALGNRGSRPGEITLTVPVNGSQQDTAVAVDSRSERTVTLSARFQSAGQYDVTVGGTTSRVEIREPTPANVTVTNVDVPDTGAANRSIPITVTLANRGELPGEMTLAVPVNGTDEETTVPVDGDAERTVTLSARFRAPGTYTITTGGADADIQIREPTPANVTVTDVDVPDTGFVNGTVPVTVTLANSGDRPGEITLAVPVNGTDEETTVSVDGEAERTITLSAWFQSPGEYDIAVGGFESRIEIAESTPANVVVTNVSTPASGFVNTSIPVTVTVENRGDLDGSVTLSLPDNGTTRETTVAVGGDTERTVTLSVGFRSPGRYDLTVGGVTAELRVRLPPADIVVVDVDVPEIGLIDTDVPVNVTLRNRGGRTGTFNVSVPNSDTTIRIAGGVERTVTVPARFRTPDTYTLIIAGFDPQVRVLDTDGISFEPLPDRAPPNATVRLTARYGSDEPVSGLPVRIGGRTATTDQDGTARVRVPADPGEYRLEAHVGNQDVETWTITIADDAGRPFLVELNTNPASVELPGNVTITTTAYNPWAATRSQELVIYREGDAIERRGIDLDPGERATVMTSVRPASTGGTQRVTARIDGTQVAETTYTVTASDRLIAQLARSGLYESGSSLVRSLDALIGNVQLLLATFFALAFLMGIGSTATVIIQAVHGRRRTLGIRRATGASPRQVTRLILGDGLRIGLLAGLLGLVSTYLGLTVLLWAGYTVLFGVRIAPLVDPWLLLGVLGGSVALVGVSSLLAAWWVLRVSPGALLTASGRRVPEDGEATSKPPEGT